MGKKQMAEATAPEPGTRTRRQLERAREAPTASDALPKYGGHGYIPSDEPDEDEAIVERISHLVLGEDKTVVPRRPGTNAVHHAFTMTPNQYRRLLEKVDEYGIEVWVDRAQFLAQGEYNVNFRDPDDHALEVCCDSPEASELIL